MNKIIVLIFNAKSARLKSNEKKTIYTFRLGLREKQKGKAKHHNPYITLLLNLKYTKKPNKSWPIVALYIPIYIASYKFDLHAIQSQKMIPPFKRASGVMIYVDVAIT